eukprot:2258088-Rhodomonas_salina.2
MELLDLLEERKYLPVSAPTYLYHLCHSYAVSGTAYAPSMLCPVLPMPCPVLPMPLLCRVRYGVWTSDAVFGIAYASRV